ncbi:hypothetical protein Slin14017_G038050 [Septoria linicola]|nr:hypothetical protein Slin14017_G038050 [Septoria linicola]
MLELLKHYETDECSGKRTTATQLRATHEALEQEIIKLQGALEKHMERLHKCKRERTALARQMKVVQSQDLEIQTRYNNPLPLDMSTAKDCQIRVLRRKLARATGTGLRSPASLATTLVPEEL